MYSASVIYLSTCPWYNYPCNDSSMFSDPPHHPNQGVCPPACPAVPHPCWLSPVAPVLLSPFRTGLTSKWAIWTTGCPERSCSRPCMTSSPDMAGWVVLHQQVNCVVSCPGQIHQYCLLGWFANGVFP